MSSNEGKIGMTGRLDTSITRAPKLYAARSFKAPFGLGRILLTRDPGEALLTAKHFFATHLLAVHRNGYGELLGVHDLGSGLTTNVGAMAISNDFAWAQNAQTLKLANYHAVGTGTTAAAATDIALQTLASPTTTTAITGAQSRVTAANSQTYQTVGVANFVSTLTITEWGLFTSPTLSATTGTPLTAVSTTSATVTGTPLTASSGTVQGQQQTIIKTGTTASYGLVVSNTTSAITIPAWYKVSDGTAGTTPGGTEAFTLLPVMTDHKIFTGIGVNSGDSITFTYSLLIGSGT